MALVDTSPPGDEAPRLPAGWRLVHKLATDADGEWGGVAELWQDEVQRCRMVITHYGKDHAAAVARINARAEHWVSEWLSRPHTGDTGFGELD